MPNYYDDSEDSMEGGPPSDKEDTSSQSALVPKSFFAGKESMEPGDTETVRILRVLDNEVEIECVKEGYNEEKTQEKEPVLASGDSGDMMD